MKNIIKKTLMPLTIFAMALGIGLTVTKERKAIETKAEIQSITINNANFGGNAKLGTNNYDSGAERTTTIGGINIGGKAITGNIKGTPSGFSAGTIINTQANNGVIYNTTPLPGRLVSLTINQEGTARSSTLYVGNSSRLVTSSTADYSVDVNATSKNALSDKSSTWSMLSTEHFTFFAIKRGANAAYFNTIVVEFEVITEVVPVDGFTIQTTDFNLYPGQTKQLAFTVSPANATNKEIMWSENSATVATVDENGLVTAVGPGTTTITGITIDGELEASVDVTVLAGTTYDLVNDPTFLYYGAHYLIAAPSHNKVLGAPDASLNFYTQTDGYIYNNELYQESTHQLVKLVRGQKAGTFSFELVGGTNAGSYFAVTGDSTNDLKTQVTKNDKTDFTVSFNGNDADIISVPFPERSIRYNATSGQERFSTYKGTNQPVSLYIDLESVNEALSPDLSSIAVTTQPTNLSYYPDQSFDPAGVVVTATYSDTTTLDVTSGVTYSPTIITETTTQIVVSYSERGITKTTNITGITVIVDTIETLSIKTLPTSTNLSLGAPLTSVGLVLDSEWTSGPKEITEGYALSGVDTMILGIQTMTVTYEGLTATYEVKVTNEGANAGDSQPATDLFISEYVEGSSNNKAIEIYNGTGSAVDLSSYTVKLGANGADFTSGSVTLSGSLADNDVYVIYNSQSNQDIKNLGDLESTPVTAFNGDDAVGLFKGTTLIDVIGVPGEDPGTKWESPDKSKSTLNSTLRRKLNVSLPNATFTWDEWDSYSIDDITDLGSHDKPTFDVTAVQQATAFKNYVMNYSENAKGKCEVLLAELEKEYDFMAASSITVFETSNDTGFADARTRMQYLRAYVASITPSQERQITISQTKESNIIATAALGVIGLTSILGYYFVSKKKRLV